MNYLIAVLPDRIQAEAAYSALENEGLLNQQVDILGKGYKSADEYGLINPNQQAGKGAKRLLCQLVPFGFVAGFAFNLLTGIEVLPAIGSLGNHNFRWNPRGSLWSIGSLSSRRRYWFNCGQR